MSTSLAAHIHHAVRQVLDGYPGAWLVWCDPRGDWAPLLTSVATDPALGGFPLLVANEKTAGEAGGPLLRRQLQERLDAGDGFVLLVPAASDALGWLWAQSLRAERIIDRPLRERLIEWGWRPQSLTISDDEVATMARLYLGQDPQEWGGGGLQPDPALLIRVLAGIEQPSDASRLILDATIEANGLPPLDSTSHANQPTSPALWRTRALARLLVTQAHAASPTLIGEGHEALISPARRAAALALLAAWADTYSLRERLAAAIVEADKPAALGGIQSAPAPDSPPFISRAAELAAFGATCRYLAALSGKELLEALAAHHDSLARRAEGFWGADWPGLLAVPWREAARLAHAARAVVQHSPAGAWATPEHAIAWYQQGGWRVDRAGEELLRTVSQQHQGLVALLVPLREAYRNRMEDLLIRWSDVWSAAGCPTPALKSAGEWLKGLLDAKPPTAVIVVDALRYDLGATLAERLNEQEGAQRANVSPARAPLPSVTALGMGMALPLAESALEAEVVAGSWQLRQKGKPVDLSDAAGRRAWWQEHGAVADALRSLHQVVEGGAIPAPGEGRKRLVIHDDAIDQLGHDDQLEVLGAEPVLARYLAAISRLHEAGWRRVLIVTDHGYIHWTGSAERQVPPPLPGALYTNRRAQTYPADATLPAPQALAPGGRYRSAFPSGAACFKAYGGLGYFHGGASLQEWIIPCIKVEWPARAAPVGIELAPLQQILSMRVRVTLQVIRPGLLPEDALPRKVNVVIRNAATSTFLFRSHEVTVTPDRDTVAVVLEPTEEPATRGTPVRIEVRDATNDEVIAVGQSTLMVEKDDWAE